MRDRAGDARDASRTWRTGQTPDMVALTALATTAPVLVAPAMDAQMWDAPGDAGERRDAASARASTFVGPAEGRLASGRMGAGRLAETPQMLGALRAMLGAAHGDLARPAHRRQRRRHAGAARPGALHRQPVDRARWDSRSPRRPATAARASRSSPGRSRSRRRSGSSASTCARSRRCALRSRRATRDCDAVIMAAAPADFRPANAAAQKMKKRRRQTR